jgi:hypothetical protein
LFSHRRTIFGKQSFNTEPGYLHQGISQTHHASWVLILFLFICSSSALGQSAGAQSPTELERARKTALEMGRPREIPEATLPCTPEEATWWQELRKAAKAVQESRDGWKVRNKFLKLLHQGQERSYRPPIPNSRALILSKAQPRYSETGRYKGIKGTVSSVAELRPDGFVGEVEIVKGVGYGLDESVAEAAHRTVFLPAVKDRVFVSFHMPLVMTFNLY